MMIYLAERGEFKLKANGTVCADSSTGSLRRLMVSWATVPSAGLLGASDDKVFANSGLTAEPVNTGCLARAN